MYRNEFRNIEGDVYWSLPRIFAAVLLALVFVDVLVFFTSGVDLVVYRVLAPRYENAKRQVFENTQGYVEGKINYLSTLRLDYEAAKAQPGGEARTESLRRLIVTEALTVDNSRLPADLRQWIADLKAGAQ